MNSSSSTRLRVYRWSNRRRSPKTDQGGCLDGDRSRFERKRLLFRAKLTFTQVVPDAHGQLLCQDSTGRLKEAVRASRQHKQRVHLAVSLQGIRIQDEMAGELLIHHPVHRIPSVSQVTSDTWAATFIYAYQDRSFHYIAIKTEKATAELEVALVALFEVVLDMKDRASRVVHQERRQQPQAWAQATSTRGE
ncbi:hypothetical protein V5799_010803 [Amblyomma americanum]|uniref:PID domain-containing protein n=1 Tax=Amblyomma americanum TaxID=6943 RepID=A0AAQ4EJ19_AMBAM